MIPTLLAIVSCAALSIGIGPGERPPDSVVLVDGTRLEGRIVVDSPDRVVIRVGSRDHVVARADVKSADSRLAAWREAMERWRLLDKEDATKIADIAAFAARLGLAEEARLFALRAVAVDPENRHARELLGHERKEKDKDWTFREQGRRYTWTERVKRAADFRDAWRLESTHWSVRANVSLLDATNAVLDLENFYAVYFDVLGPELGLHHVDAPLAAQIHGDTASFPQIAGGRGFYDRAENVLVVNSDPVLDRGLLVHEATHHLIAATGVLTRAAKAEVAPWLDEGLAEYFRATATGPAGRLVYDASAVDTRSMRSQAHATETYKLSRIMTFDPGDYMSTSRQDLKYAQSYSFVAFLMAADDARYRGRFYEFLRGAWNGKGSSTDLEFALGVKLDAVQRSWNAWVRERAR